MKILILLDAGDPQSPVIKTTENVTKTAVPSEPCSNIVDMQGSISQSENISVEKQENAEQEKTSLDENPSLEKSDSLLNISEIANAVCIIFVVNIYFKNTICI